MRRGILVGAVLVAACGDDGGHPVDARVADTKAIDATTDAAPTTCNGGKTIFLNRSGGTYNAGPADDATTNTTRVLTSGSYNVTAYPYGEVDWAEIKTCVTAGLTDFGVVVTDVDPGTAPHHEVVFTTSYAVWPDGNPYTSSISSTNCPGVGTGLPESGIAFVFTAIFGSSRPDLDCADALSQLASEIAGLDHALDCHDYLGNGLAACGPKQYLDQEISCGETIPRTCQCGGDTQSSHRAMLAALCP